MILVTGATGFIGGKLLARLAAEGDDLRILRRKNSSTSAIKNIRYEEVVGDITNEDDVVRATKNCDVVFHVAASVSYWDKQNADQYNTNVIGTRNVVNACLKNNVKRLIHTSSIVAIGLGKNGQLADESTTYNLGDLKIGYCDTKHLAEEEVQKGVRLGLDAVIVNPAAVFGPGDLRRYKGYLYGSRVWSHLFYVSGGISTVDVDDVVDGQIRAWKKGKTGERYILSNENLTFKEISNVIADVMDFPGPKFSIPTPIVFGIARLATAFSNLTGTEPLATIPMAQFTKCDLFFSNEKAKRELGMIFHPFKETIERAVEWLACHCEERK